MRSMNNAARWLAGLAVTALAIGCSDRTPVTGPELDVPGPEFAAHLGSGPNFVFTNDDVFGANTVSAFSVAANGVLTPLAGSPFLTGGSGTGGGLFASSRVTACAVGNLLYVSNDQSRDVSGFSINPATGALTAVPGSPFPTGGAGDISLAETPNGQFLMAGSGGSINVFSIAANGTLAPIAGSPFPTPGSADGMRVTPNGQFLAVATVGSVAMFSIAANGALTPVPGSPFPDGGPGAATSVDINAAGDRLFAGEAQFGNTIVDVFSIAANGALTPIAGSPFFGGVGSNSNVALLSPDDQLLFVSNQVSNSVTVFSVAADGSLTLVPGSPFPVGGGAFFTSGMATNRAGTFLYTANFPNLVGVFSIAPSGVLTSVPGSPFSTGRPTGLLSLAAFPPRIRVLEVDIDIKPSSDPNSINLGSKGVIPVAILTTAVADGDASDFDAADVDPTTVTLGDDDGNDTPVKTKKNGSLFASLEDVDGDGDLDLALKFAQPALETNGDLDASTTELILNGATFGGTPIQGSDAVRITPASS